MRPGVGDQQRKQDDSLTWITIDARALRQNFRAFRRLCHVPLMPVIKANAYGHGMINVARLLAHEKGLWGFGVATLEEALEIRKAGIHSRILVLSAWQGVSKSLLKALRLRCEVVLASFDQLQTLQKLQRKIGRSLSVHIKIDTGTARIGFLLHELPELSRRLRKSYGIQIAGIFSHLAEAEAPSERRTFIQTQTLLSAAKQFDWSQTKPQLHIGCTAAIARTPSTRLDLGRLGIGLYGLWPSEPTKKKLQKRLRLRPALSWNARILQIKQIPAGTRVGYGGTFRARTPMTIGIIPIGYADGFDRRFSNRGSMLVRGKRCHVLGRVSMNLSTIDCSSVPKARAGETATILGSQRGTTISADELADKLGTIHYEVVARIRSTIPRIIIQ